MPPGMIVLKRCDAGARGLLSMKVVPERRGLRMLVRVWLTPVALS